MKHIAFTGPRTLSKEHEKRIHQIFLSLVTEEEQEWHVGDALGLDAFVRRAHPYFAGHTAGLGDLAIYEVEGREPRDFAERSRRMIKAITLLPNPHLYAFPIVSCPKGCKPSANPTGKGSGAWLTIAYATYWKIPVKLFPLVDISLPDWL